MTPEDLRAILAYLRKRVVSDPDAAGGCAVAFRTPTAEEMIDAGLDADGVGRLLGAPWWDEMVADIVETPDLCEPGDAPEQVLAYARDVVSEYVYKRFPLEAD